MDTIGVRKMWALILLLFITPSISHAGYDSSRLHSEIHAGDLKNSGLEPQSFEIKEKIEKMVKIIRSYGFNNPEVAAAISSVPRHEFVPERLRHNAYEDTPLPIGYGQTISQPYMVAEMTRLLQIKKDSKILEVGTGSGYQAAILTHFTSHVYTIEIIDPLVKEARERLNHLGYGAVKVRNGDGYYGWPEEAPFDGIVVTAAAGEIPPPLIRQLKEGGRMVIPVGSAFGIQSLILVEKDAAGGAVRTRSIMPVRFVPFTREDKSKR